MTTVSEFHDRAMMSADRMLALRHKGQHEEAIVLAKQAYQDEAAAVRLAFELNVSVPTKLILLKSAANLGREARQFEDGIDLCIAALAMPDLRSYRRDVLHAMDTLRTYEHLQLDGVVLDDTDVQLSVAGTEAAPGFARLSEVMRRVDHVSALTRRTALRRAGAESGRPRLEGRFHEAVTPYLSVARAASYAVTLRFGVLEQIELDLDGVKVAPVSIRETLDQMMHIVSAYTHGGPSAIIKEFGDNAFARSMSQLIRDMSPDDERVHTVGLTVVRSGKAMPIALPARNTFQTPVPSAFAEAIGREALPPREIVLSGTLLEGSAKRANHAWATLISDEGASDRVYYDEATFGDVIDKYWKQRVRATVLRRGNRLSVLSDIEPAGIPLRKAKGRGRS